MKELLNDLKTYLAQVNKTQEELKDEDLRKMFLASILRESSEEIKASEQK